MVEFAIQEWVVDEEEEKLKLVPAMVKSGAKSAYMPFFMVRYGDARDLKDVIALEWGYDIEAIAKNFLRIAVKMGLKEFKIVDGNGLEYYVTVGKPEEVKGD